MEGRNNAAGTTGLMDKVRDGAVSQLNTQKDRATDRFGSVVQAVRQSTQQLREQQHDSIADYVDQAAGQLERFSNTLKEKNVSELLDEAQRFARRNPALFIGGAFALGLVSARFFKSSRDRSRDISWRDRTGTAEPKYQARRASQPGRGDQYGGTEFDRPRSASPSGDMGRS
jgi:hypothetical protein